MLGLILLWSLFVDTGCWPVVTAPPSATATSPGPAATATVTPHGPETPTPVPRRFPGDSPEMAIQERTKKITFSPGERRWFALPIDQETGKAVVDLTTAGNINELDGQIFSPDQFNRLNESLHQRTTPPVPKGRLNKVPSPAGVRLHWDGGNKAFVNEPSFFPNLPKGAWILSVTNTGPQALDTLFSVK